MTETSNVVSIAEWKANQHRKRLAGLKWTWYEVVRDPNGRIELVPIEAESRRRHLLISKLIPPDLNH